jgi:hypothetical protein
MGAATQWLFNFCITEITPRAVNHIGWRTFLMFGIFCLANGVFVFFFIKETKGRSLEDMDILFGTVAEEQRRADVEQVLHKAIIRDELENERDGDDKNQSVRLHNVDDPGKNAMATQGQLPGPQFVH